MKAGREHRVPLTSRALAIVKEMKAISRGDLVFESYEADKPLSVRACSDCQLGVFYAVEDERIGARYESAAREIAEIIDGLSELEREGEALRREGDEMGEWVALENPAECRK